MKSIIKSTLFNAREQDQSKMMIRNQPTFISLSDMALYFWSVSHLSSYTLKKEMLCITTKEFSALRLRRKPSFDIEEVPSIC